MRFDNRLVRFGRIAALVNCIGWGLYALYHLALFSTKLKLRSCRPKLTKHNRFVEMADETSALDIIKGILFGLFYVVLSLLVMLWIEQDDYEKLNKWINFKCIMLMMLLTILARNYRKGTATYEELLFILVDFGYINLVYFASTEIQDI